MGEIGVTAVSAGRRLTLEPVMPVEAIEIRPRRVESSIEAGFRVDWLTASGDDAGDCDLIELTAGAGVGSKWMCLHVKHPELGTIDEVVDMSEFVQTWVKAALARGATNV